VLCTCNSIVSLLSRNGTCESPLAIDWTTRFKAVFPWLIFAVYETVTNVIEQMFKTKWLHRVPEDK
jgi:hypothetical protein